MIEIMAESEPSTLAVTVSGRITPDDCRVIGPEFRHRRAGTFDLLVELREVDAPSVLREIFEFIRDIDSQPRHVAVVTENSPWGRFAAVTSRPLGRSLGIDVERFGDRVEAWRWLHSMPSIGTPT